jgi:hypothetical protein
VSSQRLHAFAPTVARVRVKGAEKPTPRLRTVAVGAPRSALNPIVSLSARAQSRHSGWTLQVEQMTRAVVAVVPRGAMNVSIG